MYILKLMTQVTIITYYYIQHKIYCFDRATDRWRYKPRHQLFFVENTNSTQALPLDLVSLPSDTSTYYKPIFY